MICVNPWRNEEILLRVGKKESLIKSSWTPSQHETTALLDSFNQVSKTAPVVGNKLVRKKR